MSDKVQKFKSVLEIGGSVGSSLKTAFGVVEGKSKKLGASLKDLEKKAKGLRDGLKNGVGGEEAKKDLQKLDAQIAQTKSKLNKLNDESSMGHKLGSAAKWTAAGIGLIAAEATVAAYAIFHLTEKFEDYVISAYKGGQKLSMTANQFAQFQYAAGGDFEVFQSGMKIFEKNIENGSNKTIASLEKLGLSYDKIRHKTPTEAFLDIADAMKKFSGNKTGLVANIFGRGGAELLPMLNKGRDGLKKLMDQASDLGLGVSKEDVELGKEHAAAMREMHGAIKGVNLEIGRVFAPIIANLGHKLSEFVKEHGKEFREWLEKLGNYIKDNAPTFGELSDFAKKAADKFSEFGRQLKELAPMAKSAFDALGGLTGVLIGLAAIQVAPAITALASLGAMAIAGGSITLAIAAVGALAAAVWYLVENAGAVEKELNTFFDWYYEKWEKAGVKVLDFGRTVSRVFADMVPANFGPIGFMARFADPAFGKNLLDTVRVKFWGGKSGAEQAPVKEESAIPTTVPSYLLRNKGQPSADNRVFNNHFTINAAPGMDTRSLAEMVVARLDGRQAALAGGALYD